MTQSPKGSDEVTFWDVVDAARDLGMKAPEHTAARVYIALLRHFNYYTGHSENRSRIIRDTKIRKSEVLSVPMVEFMDFRNMGERCQALFAKLQERLKA